MAPLTLYFHHHDSEYSDKISNLFESNPHIRILKLNQPSDLPTALKREPGQIIILSMSIALLDEGKFIFNLLKTHRLLQFILLAPVPGIKALVQCQELGANDVVFQSGPFEENLKKSIQNLFEKLSRWNGVLQGHFGSGSDK